MGQADKADVKLSPFSAEIFGVGDSSEGDTSGYQMGSNTGWESRGGGDLVGNIPAAPFNDRNLSWHEVI